MQDFFWSRTRDALLGIADRGLELNTDFIDIRFFNSPSVFYSVKVRRFSPLLGGELNDSVHQGRDAIISIFKEVQPRGYFSHSHREYIAGTYLAYHRSHTDRRCASEAT
jgi:hypothetical protein